MKNEKITLTVAAPTLIKIQRTFKAECRRMMSLYDAEIGEPHVNDLHDKTILENSGHDIWDIVNCCPSYARDGQTGGISNDLLWAEDQLCQWLDEFKAEE
jgi:hypothetical protein